MSSKLFGRFAIVGFAAVAASIIGGTGSASAAVRPAVTPNPSTLCALAWISDTEGGVNTALPHFAFPPLTFGLGNAVGGSQDILEGNEDLVSCTLH